MKIDYSNLEKKINIKFKDRKLLVKCLTHKSFDKIDNNEKIEFLGDRVLGLVIAKKLLEIYPNEKEGILDKKFASLVNKKTCLQIAKNINLEKYILTFNPKNRKIKIEDKVIADYFNLEEVPSVLFIRDLAGIHAQSGELGAPAFDEIIKWAREYDMKEVKNYLKNNEKK